MEITTSLSALAHPSRLRIFRLLVRRYPDAVPSGEIARALEVPANTCSVYLAALKSAGLIHAHRTGTRVAYRLDISATSELMEELLGGCCQGRPDICPDLSHLFSRTHEFDMPRPYNVLFVCTGNSARSIIAQAVLTDLGAGRFAAYSAGTKPRGEIHPMARALLSDKGMDVSGLAPKGTDTYAGPDAPDFDFVFTVCDRAANEECPLWPGQPMTAHWGMPDPAMAQGSEAEKALAFQHSFGLLRNRLQAFAALPLETLDALSLQREVDKIGQVDATPPLPA